MLRNVILGLFAFVLIGLILVWLLGGGPARILDTLQSSDNATSSEGFTLPWQPAGLFPTIDNEDLFPPDTIDMNSDEELAALQGYEKAPDIDPRTFGNPSPLFGTVRIDQFSSAPQQREDEHIVLSAPYSNTAPVSLDGWSLQSVVSGVRVPIPNAAVPLIAGTINAARPVFLEPGTTATVLSGPSPVGGSFRENICLGYLAQFQTFYPSLTGQCPSPTQELPLTPANIATFGDTCIDYVRSLAHCAYPQDIPTNITPACRSFVETTFSYNGCVTRHRSEPLFHTDSWRLYIGAQRELWGTHDAIRLLDAAGQTVDVYVY